MSSSAEESPSPSKRANDEAPPTKRQKGDRTAVPWTEAEDEELSRVVETLCTSLADSSAFDDWKTVAKQLSTKRTSKQCKDRYKTKLDPTINHGPWRDDEDEMLLKLSEEFPRQWSKISRSLRGRTEHAVKSRITTLNRLRTKDWTPEEDALLRQLKEVEKLEFEAIAPRFPTRSVHSIKKHWERLYMSTLAASIRSKQPEATPSPVVRLSPPPLPLPSAPPLQQQQQPLFAPSQHDPASVALRPPPLPSSRLKKHSTSMTVLLQLIGDPLPDPTLAFSNSQQAFPSHHADPSAPSRRDEAGFAQFDRFLTRAQSDDSQS